MISSNVIANITFITMRNQKNKFEKSEISFTKSSWQFFCFLEFIHGFLVSVSVPKFYGFIETEKTKWKIAKVVSVSMFLVFYI